jgi:deoxyxylulose-5-phosphate synthase
VNHLSKYDKVYLYEEGIKKGGICEHIVSKAALKNYSITAIDNHFVSAADINSSLRKLGLDEEAMINAILGDKTNG